MGDPRTYVPARERSSFGQFQLRPSHLKTRIPGDQFLRGDYVSTRPNVDQDAAHAAALQAAHYATDAAECRRFLEQLGLLP